MLVSAALEWAVWFARLAAVLAVGLVVSVSIYAGKHPHVRNQGCKNGGCLLKQGITPGRGLCAIHTRNMDWAGGVYTMYAHHTCAGPGLRTDAVR